ncbi:MAG TPA: hypothetical protein VFV20_04975 [Candidatus Limnocylindria bacterium]|nr:hypothetical protein [Candidatus Limnocylindria bacterium]
MRMGRTASAVLLVVATSCGSATGTLGGATATPAPSPAATTRSAEITKPPQPSQVLPPPTYARWAIDQSADPSKRLFVLFYDAPALGFRLLDAAGEVIVRVPIAGSGIFGPDTCVASAHRANEITTWAGVDEPTYRRILANIATYRLEADAVGGPTVTIPLSDSGCRKA